MARAVCGEDCEITIDTTDSHYWNYKIDPKKLDQSWGDSIYTDFTDFSECALKTCVEIFDQNKADELAHKLPECDCIRFSDGYWYKFTKKNVTKENAIIKITEVCGFGTESIIAFGDDYADIGMGCYYHIESVAKNAELLAEKYGADKEVVIIAAWLHDIASITDYSMYEEHHVYGATIAKEILNELNYEDEKTELVQKCVFNHRGSVNLEKLSKEELCVVDADAISHFDSVPSLLYLAYVERKMNIEEGV